MFKPVIDSWDVFDTLVARFGITPRSVLDLVEAERGFPGFAERRLAAQAALDAVGQPYTIERIYEVLGRDLGATRTEQRQLMHMELAAERSQLIPIVRQVRRVKRRDMLVSDMILGEQHIQDILTQTCGLTGLRPVVTGNWGKATGTVWDTIQAHYSIRTHRGDNPASDIAVPRARGIACELVMDHALTTWEKMLSGAGLGFVALLQREVRLRVSPLNTGRFHDAVLGPYLTILLLFALHLEQDAAERGIEHYAFAARDCVHLAEVFRALDPVTSSETLDLNRFMLDTGIFDGYFGARLGQCAAIVDMVTSGRTLGGFFGRTGRSVPITTLLYFDGCLAEDERRARREEAGFRGLFATTSFSDTHQGLEVLCNPGYPSVTLLAEDVGSGAAVRLFGRDDELPEERDLAAFTQKAVSELARTIRRRGKPEVTIPEARPILRKALESVVSANLDRSAHTFLVNEGFHHRRVQ